MSDFGRITLGLSAEAIAGYGTNHPWDPSDLLRCVRYCERAGISTDGLKRKMTGRSAQWDLLLPEWDHLVSLLRQEMETRDDGRAILTYIEMQRVLAGGTSCETCGGTGRGDECLKCNGTGRRCGGQCRAEDCHSGAALCITCAGRGWSA
jgi:hypothetical protein